MKDFFSLTALLVFKSILCWSCCCCCEGFAPPLPCSSFNKVVARTPSSSSSIIIIKPSTTLLFAGDNNNENDDEKASSSSSAASASTTKEEEEGRTKKYIRRRVDTIEQFTRLPVWPVWNGILIFVVSKIFGKEIAAKLEDAIGGRVCPNFFSPPTKTSPFVMLVHHRHSFATWDLLRYFQRSFILPEGFPAHPHRGFITLTYFLKGGFIHRDSLGIKQIYGAQPRHDGKHTQYLMTGSGLLHEEMFDIQPNEDNNMFGISDQELYQLWLNVPSADKLSQPFIQVIGGEEETPTIIDTSSTSNNNNEVKTTVLAGEYNGRKSAARLFSDISIFHVEMKSSSARTALGAEGGTTTATTWKYDVPSNHATALIYVRKGSIRIDDEIVPTQNTAYLTKFGNDLIVEALGHDDEADFLFLSGEPLLEPIAARGSMVMNNDYEINQAYNDYQDGKMGSPWSEKLTDEEWNDHVTNFPSIYR